MSRQHDIDKPVGKQKPSFSCETWGVSNRTYYKYMRALNRLKSGSGKTTYQAVADELTTALNDGRTINKSEVWKMMNGHIWSEKICDALGASGYVVPRKRHRLHVEFETEEQRQEIIDYFGIGENLSFTKWFFSWYDYQRKYSGIDA